MLLCFVWCNLDAQQMKEESSETDSDVAVVWHVVPSSSCEETSTNLLYRKWWRLNWNMDSPTRALQRVLTYGISSCHWKTLLFHIDLPLKSQDDTWNGSLRQYFAHNCLILDGSMKVCFHLWSWMMWYDVSSRFDCFGLPDRLNYMEMSVYKIMLKTSGLFHSM